MSTIQNFLSHNELGGLRVSVVRFGFFRRVIYGFLIILFGLASCRPIKTPTGIPTSTFALPTAPPVSSPSPSVIPQAGQQPFITEVNLRLTSQPNQTGTARYLLYLPEAYVQDDVTSWPLILYLHGSGEAGTDLNLLKRTGLPQKLEEEADFPFVVVSPQIAGPTNPADASTRYSMQNYLDMYGWGAQAHLLEGLLEYLLGTYRLDARRVYLTGISLGGFGTWLYALQYPKRFAAIVPIAGGYRFEADRLPENLCDLKDLPVWAFHGELDANVPARLDQVLVDGLKACGGEPRYTLYADTGHDAWTQAYSDGEIWNWLLEQEKPQETSGCRCKY